MKNKNEFEEVFNTLTKIRESRNQLHFEKLRNVGKDIGVIEDEKLKKDEIDEYMTLKKGNPFIKDVIYVNKHIVESIGNKIDFYEKLIEMNKADKLEWKNFEHSANLDKLIIYICNFNGKVYPSVLKNKHRYIETRTKAYIYVNWLLLIHIKDNESAIIKKIKSLDSDDVKKALNAFNEELKKPNKENEQTLVKTIIVDKEDIEKEIKKYQVIKNINNKINAIIYVDKSINVFFSKKVNLSRYLNSSDKHISLEGQLLGIIRDTVVKNTLNTVENTIIIKHTGKTFIYIETVLFISFDN